MYTLIRKATRNRSHSTRWLTWLTVGLVAALSAGSMPASAEDAPLPTYDVELLIFRNLQPTATPEDWTLAEQTARSNAPAGHDTEEQAAPPDPSITPTPGMDSSIQPLANTRFKLGSLANRLNRNRHYELLAHVGWTQPGFDLNTPRPVTITDFVAADTQLTGTATLTRGRYLHLLLDFTWTAPDGQRYVLRESRRMRSGDKHYFDHPYFGVVALVTPHD